MRRVITFRPEMLDLVLKGRKTATVRPVNGSNYSDELVLTDGRRRLTAKLRAVRRLTLNDAANYFREEGFMSREEFLSNIQRIYSGLKNDDEVNLIEFEPKLNSDI
ncbi:MAG: ASCH domain-containing protein [Candidatus Caldarchaeum sp.]|nr:ASCH domain-containing protein [Candidatus Caldarchaeum sp.]